jgi:hypothetical protein
MQSPRNSRRARFSLRVIEGRSEGQLVELRRIAPGTRIVQRGRRAIGFVARRGDAWRAISLEGQLLGIGGSYLHCVAMALRPRL